jgi:polysaccharide biosynthesis/export protein
MTTHKNHPSLRSNRNVGITSILVLITLLSSCVTQRKVEYLQDRNRSSKSFVASELSDYKLKAGDELYIQISSLDEASANVFSSGKDQAYSLATMQPYGASLLSYTIDKEGFLLLPVLGKIPVRDKTLSEVSDILKESLTHVLNQPVVTVKLVNRYVSVLGEVKSAGHFSYSQEKISIYDALGLAGDITEYGNRNNVILIRNENGRNTRINIDLTKSDILSSEFYTLRPNDIVYVKPLRKKFWGMREFPFSVILSTLTTGILIYSVVK